MSPQPRKSILLVEDEVIIAMVEKRHLASEGYDVVHLTRGEEAIEYICVKNHSVDLVLMDIDLGKGIDGTQAAQEILKTKLIPILFLSSHTEPEIVEKTEKITSYGYVVKNSGDVVLLASIKMAFKLHFDYSVLVPLGIIVNELITNAMKHGFSNREKGTLRVTMVKNACVVLEVRDDGIGLSSDRRPVVGVGSGTALVESLARQLDGSFSMVSDHGTVCTCTFALTGEPGGT